MAIAALEQATMWVDAVSPGGVLAYREEETRGVLQTGIAAFMRNWPYADDLCNGDDSSDDSAVKGLFDVTTLPTEGDKPTSAATLGGWNVAVSKYSKHQAAEVSFTLCLADLKAQKYRARTEQNLPTINSLYDDADIAAAQPNIPQWKDVFFRACRGRRPRRRAITTRCRPILVTGAKLRATWPAMRLRRCVYCSFKLRGSVGGRFGEGMARAGLR